MKADAFYSQAEQLSLHELSIWFASSSAQGIRAISSSLSSMPSLLLNNHGSCQPIISSSAQLEALRLMFIWTSSLSATDRITPWLLASNRLIIGCNSAKATCCPFFTSSCMLSPRLTPPVPAQGCQWRLWFLLSCFTMGTTWSCFQRCYLYWMHQPISPSALSVQPRPPYNFDTNVCHSSILLSVLSSSTQTSSTAWLLFLCSSLPRPMSVPFLGQPRQVYLLQWAL